MQAQIFEKPSWVTHSLMHLRSDCQESFVSGAPRSFFAALGLARKGVLLGLTCVFPARETRTFGNSRHIGRITLPYWGSSGYQRRAQKYHSFSTPASAYI